MAKTPTLKQQLIQEIANQQVAQFRQAQQNNDDIAQLQAQYDAWQNQQEVNSLQAQYDAWVKEQTPAQPAQTAPVQTAPVEKKAQTQTKARKPIPTLETHRSIRNDQEEAKMLAKEAAQKKAISNVATNQTLNRLADMTTIGLGKAPVVDQNEVIQKYAQAKGISVDQAKAEYEKAEAMRGQNIAKPGQTDEALTKTAQEARAEELRKANQKQQTAYESFLNGVGNAVTAPVAGPVRLAGALSGKGWDVIPQNAREQYRNAQEQHRFATDAGNLAGMMLLAGAVNGGGEAAQAGAKASEAFNAAQGEALLNGATKAEATRLGLGIGGRQMISNVAAQMPFDVATDIIPTMANDVAEGKSTKEVVLNTLLNTGINAGFNSIGDIVGLGKAVKRGVPTLSKYEPPVGRLTAQELESLNTNPVEANNKQFSDLMNTFNSQFKDESAMKNIFTPEDLEASQNAQLKSLMEENLIPERVNPVAEMKGLEESYANDELIKEISEMNDEMGNLFAPEIDNFNKNTLDNVNTSVYDGGVNNVDSIMRGNENGTDIGKGYDGTTGEGILRTDSTEGPLGSRISANGVSGGNYLPADRVSVSDNVTKYPKVFDEADAQKLTQFNIPYNDYYDAQEPGIFSKALETAKVNNPHGGAVDSHTPEEIQEILNNGGKTFLTADGTAGGAVDNGNLTAVFKDNLNNDTPRAASSIAIAGVKNGAIKGDCFGQFLVNSYSKGGFEPVARMKYTYGFNELMDQQVREQLAQGLIKSEPDVYALKLMDGYDYQKAIDGYNTARKWTQQELDSLPLYDDYDEMLKYRDSLIKEQPNQAALFSGENAETSPEIIMAEDIGLNPDTELNEIVESAGRTRPRSDSISESWEVKERGLSKHIRNADTPMRMEDVADEVIADFEDNPAMYTVLKNSETKAKAERIYDTSDNPMVEFRDMLRVHDPAALPLGNKLAQDLSAKGDHAAAAQIYMEMGEQLTKSGQFSQAAVINMVKNDPLTALNYAEREIAKINQTGRARFGDKWNDFNLTADEIDAFKKIKPGNEEAIKNLYDEIGVRLGKDYPTTFIDKLLEGRKIAMLFNVRTNVRNAGANIPTLGMRWVSDRVEAVGQNIAHLINPDFEVTQAVRGSGAEGRRIAKEAWNNKKVQALVNGTAGKYEVPELKSSLMQNKQMYKGTAVSKWIDKVTDGGIQKVNEKFFGKKGVQSTLETIRNATYKALDLGDSPFVKENFIERLGSYIRAQGIKNVDDIPDEALQIAWEEAMKATYKDNSWAVQMLSNMKKGIEKIPGVGRALSQAAIPFLQAPGNIAARMVDYSPIKATKGIADIISGAKKTDMKLVSKGIEEASKGLTGTAAILLGMKLHEAGIITGSYSKDNDQRAFEKQSGYKEYALHVGDRYFTYDWAQPAAEPLIIGTLLSDAIQKSDEYNSDILNYFGVDNPIANKAIGVAKEGTRASINSWFNASPLQGLQELLSGGYTGTDIAGNIAQVGVSDFAGAFVPASVNAVAKSIDNTQRNTYDASNSFSTFVQQQKAKIPGLSKTLPAKYDTWGREMKYAENKVIGTVSRFVVPGDYSYDKGDKIDQEIMRLYEATDGDKAVFPHVAPTDVNGKKLNSKQVSMFQKDMGQRSRALTEDLINSAAYKKLEDAEKVEVLDSLYKASKAITERDKFGKEPSNNNKHLLEVYDKAGKGTKGQKALVEELLTKNTLAKHDVSDTESARAVLDDLGEHGLDKYAKFKKKLGKSTKSEDIQNVLDNSGMSKTNKATYYSYLNSSASPGQNPYDYVPGINYDPDKDESFQKAKAQLPSLKPVDFYKTKDKVDMDSNGSIKQQELVDYLNEKHISEKDMEKYWAAYGSSEWKKVPYLKNGVWYLPKK